MWRVSGPLGSSVAGYLSIEDGSLLSPKVRLKSTNDYCAEFYTYMPSGGSLKVTAVDKEEQTTYVWSNLISRQRTWQMIQIPVNGLNGVYKLEISFEGDSLNVDEFSFHQKSCLSRKFLKFRIFFWKFILKIFLGFLFF